jgi:DNA repair exonuclease SbcCD nuclease subunit
LAGDIVHSKVELSPEMIQLTFDFLRRIADLFPTILIPGNHDCSLNNSSRLDALSPIVDNLKHPNLYYLKDTGLYQFGNCVFSVMSIFDEKNDYITGEEIPNNYTKIALYHGPVNTASTDVGYKVTNSKISMNDFMGFDLAIFGDIHKKQMLSEYKVEEAIIDEPELNWYRANGWEVIEKIEDGSPLNKFLE